MKHDIFAVAIIPAKTDSTRLPKKNLQIIDGKTMLEHSIYTVASPEASASILWRDSSKASEAANSMRITAQDLIEMKIIDGIVTEPIGGAHRNHQKIIKDVEKTIIKNLSELTKLDRAILVDNRRNKFLSMGRNI